MSYDQKTEFMPFPEIVEEDEVPKPYEIIDSIELEGLPSTGMVSKTRRVMLIPLSEGGSSTIRHELAHVRWSPSKLPKVPYDEHILLAVEDARINIALARRGLGVELSPELLRRVADLAAGDLKRKDVAVFVLRAIASLGTNGLSSVVGAYGPGWDDARELARRLVSEVEARLEQSRLRSDDLSIAAFADAKRAAKEVARELDQKGLKVIGSQSLLVGLAEGGCCVASEPPKGSALWRLLEATGRMGHGSSSEDITAAEMTIVEPALPIPCRSARPRAIGPRARRQGALIRNANRWFSDRAIFRGRARAIGGSVLVDTSNSMQLNALDVDRIVRGAPNATLVAIYSGKDGRGELRIIARNGRRAADSGLVPFGPGNLVDLPALKWLARQPAPRVWLSDGQVTGVHDWASSLLERRCHSVCRRFRIRRVESVEEASAVLDGRPLRLRTLIPGAVKRGRRTISVL